MITTAKIIAWLKTSKAWVYALLALGVSILTLVLRSFFSKPSDTDHGKFTIPPAPGPLQAAVDKAQDEAQQAQAQALATSEAQRQRLTDIAAVSDGAERRKQLAAFLQSQ